MEIENYVMLKIHSLQGIFTTYTIDSLSLQIGVELQKSDSIARYARTLYCIVNIIFFCVHICGWFFIRRFVFIEFTLKWINNYLEMLCYTISVATVMEALNMCAGITEKCVKIWVPLPRCIRSQQPTTFELAFICKRLR